MSNALSIAAVTATVQNLLVNGLNPEISNANNITVRPLDKAREGNATPSQLNIFLYQTLPSPALRNMDLPGTKPGETAFPPLAINLFYLLTAYGENDDDLIGHRVLGRAMSVMHDHPVLGREEIRLALEDSKLHEQVERIRIAPQPLSVDELSKLWNTFQTQYRISAAYQITVVLIESNRPSINRLPVISRGSEDQGVITVADQPAFLNDISLPNGKPGAELGDVLTIQGAGLTAASSVVRFRHSLLTDPIELPATLVPIVADGKTQTALRVKLPSTSDDPGAAARWPAGFYAVTVIVNKPGLPTWTTNALSFALVPTVTLTEPEPSDPPPEVDEGNVDLEFDCRPRIRENQRIELLIDDRTVEPTSVNSDDTDPTTPTKLVFDNLDVAARQAPYTLRIRVDGVDSIPFDLTQTPPQFRPNIQIKVNST